MKMQILHCGTVVFEDDEPSKKPNGISPQKTQNIVIDQKADMIDDAQLSSLLRLFEQIDIDSTYNSPIEIKYDYLQEKLGLNAFELKRLMARARRDHLLTRLTIDKEYGAWIRKSKYKGSLVVMTCIEKKDSNDEDIGKKAATEIQRSVKRLTGYGQFINNIVIVPNAHMISEELETDSKKVKTILNKIEESLASISVPFVFASFGYGKRVKLVIRGHPEAYKFHQI